MSRPRSFVTLPRGPFRPFGAGRIIGWTTEIDMARGELDPLVPAARSGDHAAWKELYLLHNRRLTVWLRSLPLPDVASSAEDIAAEAWLTAAAKIHGFKGADDDFPGWLFTIARNHASNSRRTALRRRTDPVSVQESPESTWGYATSDHAHVDDLDTTRRLLEQLTPREAEVVACIDIVGLDVASTATALGMRPTAVRVARHRALGRLRRLLAALDEPAADEPDPAPRGSTTLTPQLGGAPARSTPAAPRPGH
jgi:RNA polymerase sigma-70 factor (ECF subfamily)